MEVGRRFLRSHPSRRSEEVEYLSELSRRPGEPALLAALGDALVFAGERGRAVRAYGAALARDPPNEVARNALERLHVLPVPRENRLPFSLDELFTLPTWSEVDTVWARWERRDLEPRDVTIVKEAGETF